jgi:PTS system N-acetylglucosamine-specific IIC component
MIERFNLSTPGRNQNLIMDTVFDEEETNKVSTSGEKVTKFDRAAVVLVEGLGGKNNIVELSNCATRLRLVLKDASKVNETTLKRGGSLGLVKISKTSIQVVIGPKVEIYVNAIEKII